MRGRVIGLQTQRPHRLTAGESVDVEHPGKRAQHGVVGLEVAIRTGLPERRDRQKNQRPVGATQLVPSKPEPRHRAGSEAFDNDIGGAREPAQNLGALGSMHVKRERAFVEIIEPEEQRAVGMRNVVQERADFSRGVAARRFDFDHVGAEIGEQTRA